MRISIELLFKKEIVCNLMSKQRPSATMDKQVKKVNWSAEERDVLVSKLEGSAVATGKFTPSVTANDKARFWTDVTDSVNSVSCCKRSVEQVKKKWIDLKSQTKKKSIVYMQQAKKTGGGPAPVLELDHWESKVLQAIPSCSVKGIENGTDIFLESNDPPVTFPDLPVGTVTECVISKETHSTKNARCENASKCETGPVPKKARCDKETDKTVTDALQLVHEQTAVMRDLVTSVQTLAQSVNDLKKSIDKLNEKDYLFHL